MGKLRGAGLQSCGRRPRRPKRVLQDPRRPGGLPHKAKPSDIATHACATLVDPVVAQRLRHRNLNESVLRARPGDRAAVAVHAPVVANPQDNRPQPQRLLALDDALAAAVALFLVDEVLVEIVGGVFRIGLADRLARNGVARAQLLARQSSIVHRAGDVEVGRTDVAAAAAGVVVYGPHSRQRDDALGGAEITSGHAHLAEPAVEAARRIHLPDHLPVRFPDQESGATAQGRQHGAAGGLVQQIPSSEVLAHTATGSKTNIASFTVSATYTRPRRSTATLMFLQFASKTSAAITASSSPLKL